MIRFFFILIFNAYAGSVQALPGADHAFCQIYPESPHCANGGVSCSFCHNGPPALALFGQCIKKELQGPLLNDLSNALASLENKDCDKDGFTNLKEIILGSLPGDSRSRPEPVPKTPKDSCESRDAESDWQLCRYDEDFAYKRIVLDFCGHSPSFQDFKLFKNLSREMKREVLQETLDHCLASAYYRGPEGFVWNLAHDKIRPLQTIKSGTNRGPIALGDYDDDYHLFVYHHLDDRDVRGLLMAQYFVQRQGLEYFPVREVPLHPQATGVVKLVGDLMGGVQQFVPTQRRAGMMTTLWFAVNNTMFTSIPRTTAAQAMRSYLDIDIAKSEGLIEPKDPNFVLRDHDSKGITDQACAFCHKVLDPASYPFSKYNGLSFNVPGNREINLGDVFDENSDAGLNIPGFIPQFLVTLFINNSATLAPGIYKERRMSILAEMNSTSEPLLAGTPERGFLLGEPVANLVEWARVAANSEDFAKTVVKDYWRAVVKLPLEGKAGEEFNDLWRKLMTEDQYSVRRMLHRLVFTEAYGAP